MTAEEFWTWFVSHEAAVRAADGDAAASLVADVLAQHDPRLGVLVAPGEPNELIVTAGGDAAAFGDVEALVAAAPSLPAWTFIALKPAQGFRFQLQIAGRVIRVSDLVFEPLTSEQAPGQLGIRLFMEGAPFAEANRIGRMILETGLGERAAARIAHVDVRAQSLAPDGALGVEDLPRFVDWFAERAGPAGH